MPQRHAPAPRSRLCCAGTWDKFPLQIADNYQYALANPGQELRVRFMRLNKRGYNSKGESETVIEEAMHTKCGCVNNNGATGQY